jgi:hypothetical protein
MDEHPGRDFSDGQRRLGARRVGSDDGRQQGKDAKAKELETKELETKELEAKELEATSHPFVSSTNEQGRHARASIGVAST